MRCRTVEDGVLVWKLNRLGARFDYHNWRSRWVCRLGRKDGKGDVGAAARVGLVAASDGNAKGVVTRFEVGDPRESFNTKSVSFGLNKRFKNRTRKQNCRQQNLKIEQQNRTQNRTPNYKH